MESINEHSSFNQQGLQYKDLPPLSLSGSQGNNSNSRFTLSGLIDPSQLPANFGGSGANLHLDNTLFMKSAEVINQAFPSLQIPGYTPSQSQSHLDLSSYSNYQQQNQQEQQQQQFQQENGNSDQHALIPMDTSVLQKVNGEEKPGTFINVTSYLTLPQHAAAKKMGIPSSTLSKRWKEASCSRKWPFRTVSKLDKEILTLLKNVESNSSALAPHVEETLGILLKRRQEELRTVIIRL
jgi:hypothetical protein